VRRVLILILLLLSVILSGCNLLQNTETPKKTVTEQDVRDAVTELINGINDGNTEVVQKYVGAASPIAESLIEKLKGNVKLSNVRDISVQGTNAQATVTLEVVPLKVSKDVTLNFNVADVLQLNSPLGLLSILL